MTRDDIIEKARNLWLTSAEEYALSIGESVEIDLEDLEVFAKLVAAHEREVIADQFWGCVMSDLEHGVKSLNEKAASDFQKNMPDLSNFGGWLDERGQE